MGLRLQLVPKPAGRPDFLDLPWDQPLDDWESDRLAVVARGVGRHVVRFVEYDGRFYALKELPHDVAHREYKLLRALTREGLPAVEAVGIVHRPELEDVLLTRYLEYSLPFRLVLGGGVADVRARLPTRSPSCSSASTSPGSSGATARSRTRSSAAMRARSSPTSSTSRPASGTTISAPGSASTTSRSRRRTSAGELLDVAAEVG